MNKKSLIISIVISLLLILSLSIYIAYGNYKTKELNKPYVAEFEEQPFVANDILCFNPALGHVYSCFPREDGHVQIRINPEGNWIITQTLDNSEYIEQLISDGDVVG